MERDQGRMKGTGRNGEMEKAESAVESGEGRDHWRRGTGAQRDLHQDLARERFQTGDLSRKGESEWVAERHRELSLLSVLSLRKPHLGEVTRTATNCSSAAGVSGLRLRQLEGPKAVSPGTRGRPRRGQDLQGGGTPAPLSPPLSSSWRRAPRVFERPRGPPPPGPPFKKRLG